MKTKSFWMTFFVMMTLTISAFSQTNLKEDIDYIQREWGSTKKDLVRNYMKLAEPQATAFWKVYDAYEAERKELGAKRLMLLNDYGMHVESLTPEKTDEIAKATLKNYDDYQHLYTEYYKKAKKAVGSILAAKFIQAENALQTAINHETQLVIPFISQLENEKKK